MIQASSLDIWVNLRKKFSLINVFMEVVAYNFIFANIPD